VPQKKRLRGYVMGKVGGNHKSSENEIKKDETRRNTEIKRATAV
jgi:hypothetical protein